MVTGITKKQKQRPLLILCAVFYFGFMLADGPFWAVDSNGYYTMHVFREPLYVIFLAVCRHLPLAGTFSYMGYAGLWYAVTIQNIVWIYATYRAGMLFFHIAEKSHFSERLSWCMAYSAVSAQMGVCLLNRFAARRGAMYANHILTEALAMPLYLLFFCGLYRLLEDFRWQHLIRCIILGFFLTELRKQMQVVLLLWILAAVLFYTGLLGGKNKKALLVSLTCCALIVLSGRLFDRCYYLLAHGSFRSIPGSHEAILCTLLYMADEQDLDLFRENEATQKGWFEDITRAQRERKARSDALAPGAGWRERAAHFALSYDVIGYEIVHPVLEKADEKEGYTDEAQKTARMYDLEGQLTTVLRRQDLAEYLLLFGSNFISAILLSVSKASPLPARMWGGVVCSLYLILLFLIRGQMHIRRACVLTLLAVIVNSAAVSALIFPQGRYMIYNMGLFYAVLPLMICGVIYEKRT